MARLLWLCCLAAVALTANAADPTKLWVTCDNVLVSVVFDDSPGSRFEYQTVPSDCGGDMSKACEFPIPSWVTVVRVTCRNHAGPNYWGQFGMLAAMDNGVVSDRTWDCLDDPSTLPADSYWTHEIAEYGTTNNIDGIPDGAHWIWSQNAVSRALCMKRIRG